MRYIVEKVTFDKTHPIWANQDGFFIKDLHNGRLSWSYWTKIELAQQICHNKNINDGKTFSQIYSNT
jgi:hypothetical protein